MHNYLFDCRFNASIRINAKNRKTAEADIHDIMSQATMTIGIDSTGKPITVTLDIEDGVELVEVDGEL